MVKPITIFISYAHKDTSYLNELQTFLKPYLREKTIDIWTDKDIVAGQQWNELIKAKLNESEVILFLVSPDFLASDYINDTEIKNAIENNKLITIPIIIRPIDMSLLRINYLQIIPTGAKAVADWDSRDTAWVDVISALKIVFKKIKMGDPENISDNKPGTNQTLNFARSNFSDTLVKWLFVLLIAFCIYVFVVYGLMGDLHNDNYYFYPSLAGMAGGLTGYLFVRKF